MTDRPVYRPGQKVNFKVWLRQPRYDQQDISVYAKKSVTLIINNGKGEKVLEKQYTCDAWGGFNGSLDLGEDANLGQYRMWIKHHGGGQGNFRVEEYKKPEFEVIVEAPKEPIALGEKFTATIKARYYFGAPVTEAHGKIASKIWSRLAVVFASTEEICCHTVGNPLTENMCLVTTVPGSAIRPRSFLTISTIIRFSARSFSEDINSFFNLASSSANRPRGRVPFIGSVRMCKPSVSKNSSGETLQIEKSSVSMKAA